MQSIISSFYSDSAYSVPAPPSHPAQLQRPGHGGHGKPAQARVNSAQLAAMRGFVGPVAADLTPWLALQINPSVFDGLCSRASLLFLRVLAQSHEQAYELAALREL